MIAWYILAIFSASFLISFDSAYGQAITVPESTPCFMNYTAGTDMWDNCGAKEDYLTFSLLGWEWITGGYFSMILVSLFVLISYIKYHNALYPIMIGVAFLPISYQFFPETFLSWAVIMVGIVIGISIWYALTKQTKEY